MKDLLICIAYHHSAERLKYLDKVLYNILENYQVTFDIVIDTNSYFDYSFTRNHLSLSYNSAVRFGRCVTFHINPNLNDPYHLTWFHRQHMSAKINQYRNFMYLEDDMLLPFENYLNYLDNFKVLYPKNFIPSFVRIEKKEGEQYVTDITQGQTCNYVHLEEKSFTTLSNPYHAFWIMPQAELLASMQENDFTKIGTTREMAASYPMWTLNKTPLVELDGHHVSRKCYAYHLPNNYALDAGSAFGKIKPENIFI